MLELRVFTLLQENHQIEVVLPTRKHHKFLLQVHDVTYSDNENATLAKENGNKLLDVEPPLDTLKIICS